MQDCRSRKSSVIAAEKAREYFFITVKNYLKMKGII